MTTDNKGLPGMRRIEHIGITVPDLHEAIDFFVNVLGCEEVYSMGSFKDPEGIGFLKTSMSIPGQKSQSFEL